MTMTSRKNQIRKEARRWAFEFLFQYDFQSGEDLEQSLEDFWQSRDHAEDGVAFAESLIRGVNQELRAIDRKLQSYAKHWDLKRMGAVDRNIMRLALYEMLFREDIPPVVSINEAVDIAKAYSSRESGRFVNGILDRAIKDIDRPHRTSKPAPEGS